MLRRAVDTAVGAHEHADLSTADALLLATSTLLVVVVLVLLLRRPRVRARADGRWRLPQVRLQPKV